MVKCESLILIGSTGRNSGKTYLAAELIRRFARVPVAALKITGFERGGGPCPRGGEGCGACNIKGEFCLEEELSDGGDKDTALLLAAGARRVFWLRCLRSALEKGFAAFLERAGAISDSLVICESNSLREVIAPGFFIMIRDSGGGKPKPSAERVAGKADFMLQSPILPENIEELLVAMSEKGMVFTNNT
ncbi:MAG: hypothetical protein LBJ86_07020 [Spirochaetaceae bacterium]|jgi:hypothetical protein|nr:hypothetical protein [Spirochaetaceae bacterium]